MAIFLFLFVFDKSGVGKGLLNQLHDSAYQSKMYKKDGTSDRKDYLETLPIRNKLNQLAIDDQFISTLFDSVSVKNTRKMSKKLSKNQNHANSDTSESVTGDLTMYDEAFYQYLLQQRCLIGCSGILYPEGYNLNLFIKSYQLREGMAEDFIVFLCNNHSLLSCIYRVRGSPVSRNACRILYLVQNSIAFFMSALNNLIFAYVNLNPRFSYLSDVVIVTPVSIFLGSVILEFYSCKIINNVEFARGSYGKYGKCLAFIGKLMAFPFIILIFLLLVLAALCTNSSDVTSVILSFILQVQLQSILLEFLYALVLFYSGYFYQLRVMGIPVVEMGSIFAERVLKCMQPEYYMYYTSMMGGFIAMDFITNKIVSNKSQVVSSKPKDVYSPNGIETPTSRITQYGNYYDSGVELSATCINPLHTLNVSQAIIPESELTTHSSFSDEYTNSFDINGNKPDRNQPSLNPLLAARSALRKVDVLIADEDQDSEDSLREEFREHFLKLQDSTSDETGMSDEFSFEEWQVQRKILKEGVKRHYEDAFRFFEKKELEVGIAAPKITPSIQRAMGLHNALDNKSNPLALKRHSAGKR